MDKEKNLKQETEEMIAETAPNQEAEENSYLITFKSPFVFEGISYKSIDLSGLESLSAADMIAVNKVIERGGTVNTLPEMSLEYACLLSARASGKPVEFFKALPPKDAMQIKRCVTSFLYNED